VTPYCLLLFGGRIFLEEKKSMIKVDNWIKFKMDAEGANVVKNFRLALDNLLRLKVVVITMLLSNYIATPSLSAPLSFNHIVIA